MFQNKKTLHFICSLMLITLVLSLATFAVPARAATSTIYNALPSVLPPSMPSLGFQATQTAEFGDHIHLGGTDRALSSVTLTMVTWAYHSLWSSMPVSGWTHPITLNIYNVDPGTPGYPGTLITTHTQTFDIPWRPEPDTTGTCTGTTWLAPDGSCNNGYAFNITFDMSSLNVTLPDEIIVGIAYNTQTWGYSPIGTSGPYNSLNVGVQGSATVGSDDNTNNVYWNTSTAGYYADGGAGGVGIFREDTNWTPYGTLPVQIVTQTYPTTTAITSDDPDPSAVGQAVTVNFTVTSVGGTPTGNVTVSSGADSCTGTVAAGTCTLTLTSSGTKTLTATYAGDTKFLGSSGTATHVVAGTAQTSSPTTLPVTGFPQGRVTVLPEQPASKAYASTDLVLEIPSLNQKMTIVGVPQTDTSWDVTWLGNNVGWLNGSAFPTWLGNTVLTGHVWDAYNQPGPFANLKELKYGDQILIHAYGQTYTYEVRESKTYWAKTAVSKVFQHEELDWVTLITCETYNPLNGDYFFRRAVRAVLVGVK